MLAVGDAPADALVRPGRDVVHLVFSQDGAQVRLAEDQHAVEEFSAQGADQSFADRVHPRSLDGRAHDPRVGGWKTASNELVKFDPRSRITNLMSSNRSPRLRARLRALLHRPVPGWVRSDAAQMHPAGTVLDEHQPSPCLPPAGLNTVGAVGGGGAMLVSARESGSGCEWPGASG
jgi:hypothetical protein